MKSTFVYGCAIGLLIGATLPAGGEVARYTFTNCRATADEFYADYDWNLQEATLQSGPAAPWTLVCPIYTDDTNHSNVDVYKAEFFMGSTCSGGRTAKLCVTFRSASGGVCGTDMNFTGSTYSTTSAFNLAALLYYPEEPSYLSMTSNSASCTDIRGYKMEWQ